MLFFQTFFLSVSDFFKLSPPCRLPRCAAMTCAVGHRAMRMQWRLHRLWLRLWAVPRTISCFSPLVGVVLGRGRQAWGDGRPECSGVIIMSGDDGRFFRSSSGQESHLPSRYQVTVAVAMPADDVIGNVPPVVLVSSRLQLQARLGHMCTYFPFHQLRFPSLCRPDLSFNLCCLAQGFV